MTIPFIDLQAQRRRLGEPLNKAIAAAVEGGQWILGPQVTELEKQLAVAQAAEKQDFKLVQDRVTEEEIARIIDGVKLKDYLGVCVDTCHLHEGGYDIINDLDGVLAEFDYYIGLDRIKAVHLNDSKNPIGAHKDRHEKIGEGHIGLEALVNVITHPKLRHLPFCLETPNDNEGYAREISLLRSEYDKRLGAL